MWPDRVSTPGRYPFGWKVDGGEACSMSLKKQPGVSPDPVIIFVCSPEWGLLGCLDSFTFDYF